MSVFEKDCLKDEPHGPDVSIHERPLGHYQGVSIADPDGGYKIESHRDDPVIEYDKSKYRIVPQPQSGDGENIERFKFVRK